MSESVPPTKPSTPNIRAVIFDLGGVILRTEDPAPRTQLAERLGKTRQELEDIVFGNPVSLKAEEGKATVEEVWETIRQLLNLKPEEVRPVRRAFFGGDRVDFDLVDLIRSLRPAYQTALLSNTWIVDLPFFIEDNLKIPTSVFDVVVSSAQQGVAKPKAEIYQAALRQLQAQPDQAVFVDDNDRNIEGAQKAGLHTVRFRSAEQARQELFALISKP